jgi:hypothetical protein
MVLSRLSGGVAGAVAPPLLVIVLVAATAAEWPFLRENGWSVWRRTEVGWPSILAAGGGVWAVAVSVAFAVCGILACVFALSLFRAMSTPPSRVGAFLLAVVAGALVLVAVPADPPNVGERSWHAQIHDVVYPIIPVGSIIAAALLAWGLARQPGWRPQARLSLAVLLVSVPSFFLTGVDAVGQLARYVLFGALLVWLELLAVALLRSLRGRHGS